MKIFLSDKRTRFLVRFCSLGYLIWFVSRVYFYRNGYLGFGTIIFNGGVCFTIGWGLLYFKEWARKTSIGINILVFLMLCFSEFTPYKTLVKSDHSSALSDYHMVGVIVILVFCIFSTLILYQCRSHFNGNKER